MIHQTKGIILHRLKYSDSKLVLKIFTREFGLQPYLFFISKSAKKKSAVNLIQPMYLLDLQVYYKENTALQKIKEFSVIENLTTIPFDIKKQLISLFLAEFLLKVLQENHKDPRLFDFIFNAISRFDRTTKESNNFHLFFLCQLTEYLGIIPRNNFSGSHRIFDLEKAKFIIGHPNHRNFFNESLSLKFSELLKVRNDIKPIINLSNSQRRELLAGIINFYNFHLDRPGKIKSLEILSQIFS
jgi:DNA repair protein RecO (recombination protein O)